MAPNIVTPDRILTFWNKTVTAPYRQARMTPKRMKHLRARIREHADWSTWKTGIQAIERSLFARGLKGWRCSFTSIAERRDLIQKAAEGQYDYNIGDAPTLERKARQLREGTGGCTHDPRCSSDRVCLEEVVWGLFEDGEREPDNRRPQRTRFQVTGGR